MWSDQRLKDAWENLDDVAYRLRRGNTHYHNLIEILATCQDLLQYVDRFRARLDELELELKHQARSHPPEPREPQPTNERPARRAPAPKDPT